MLSDTKMRHLKLRDKLYKVNERDEHYVAVTAASLSHFATITPQKAVMSVRQRLDAISLPPGMQLSKIIYRACLRQLYACPKPAQVTDEL